MEPVAQVDFADLEESCAGFVLVQIGPGKVGIAVSLENDGDVDICITPDNARAIAVALEVAANYAEGKKQ
jgi:hypothetical protein